MGGPTHLTGSYRAAAALAGVDHQTVRARVAARAAGLDPMARLVPPKPLGAAAAAGRFAAGDLESIVARPAVPPAPPSAEHSLQPGTAAWEVLGR